MDTNLLVFVLAGAGGLAMLISLSWLVSLLIKIKFVRDVIYVVGSLYLLFACIVGGLTMLKGALFLLMEWHTSCGLTPLGIFGITTAGIGIFILLFDYMKFFSKAWFAVIDHSKEKGDE